MIADLKKSKTNCLRDCYEILIWNLEKFPHLNIVETSVCQLVDYSRWRLFPMQNPIAPCWDALFLAKNHNFWNVNKHNKSVRSECAYIPGIEVVSANVILEGRSECNSCLSESDKSFLCLLAGFELEKVELVTWVLKNYVIS